MPKSHIKWDCPLLPIFNYHVTPSDELVIDRMVQALAESRAKLGIIDRFKLPSAKPKGRRGYAILFKTREWGCTGKHG